MSATQQRHRIRYALGALLLLGAATTLVVLARGPAYSATRLPAPVPAPEIFVAEESAPPTEPWVDPWAVPGATDTAENAAGRPAGTAENAAGRAAGTAENAAGRAAGTGTGTALGAPSRPDSTAQSGLTDPSGLAAHSDLAAQSGLAARSGSAARTADDGVRRSLFWSGLLGLAVSFVGMGMIGFRRRQW
ncbi:hypothetical protein ACN28G_26520 [Micromonospora sp. WMMA1923]|uniref:hypothetical protein n=1 Tax=Micromonospora sp. WMMA1923 TaxID=3404125 RepID=UPI003B935D9E